MDARQLAILITLVAYKVVLLGIGLVARRWNRDEADFLLGGRSLGPLVAAISASASSSSAWTLLGVSGFAYLYGVSAIWLFPSCVGGFALNWFVLAPRLRAHSAGTGAVTATEVLAGPPGRAGRHAVVILASAIILFSFTVYVASQLRGAAETFDEVFGMDPGLAIVIGAAVVITYTLLGGFWAVSLTDTLQGLLMATTSIALPIAALLAIGGPSSLGDVVAEVSVADYGELFGSRSGFAACLGFVAGLAGIGLGYPGQPHVVNRFMALPDDASVARARIYSLLWAVTVYSGMIVLGLCGRGLVTLDVGMHERVFMAVTEHVFHPVVAGVMIAAVLSAMMSTVDSQLLVAASSVSHDLAKPGLDEAGKVRRSRVAVFALSVAATVAAMLGSQQIFKPVLFAWTAMGAAFGPLLLWTVWRGPVSAIPTFAAMSTGFAASVWAYLAGEPSWMQRVVPFALTTAVLLIWGRRPPTAAID